MQRRTAIVFAGGDPPPRSILEELPEDALVIAADAGHDHAVALGQTADRIVGDLDSADLVEVRRAVAAGAELEEHPEDKDATDLELSLASALSSGVEEVVVIGGHGGRLDHFLANALAIASPQFASMRIRAHLGDAVVTVVHSEAMLSGAPGDICSLLAVGAPATGVTTTGLRFALDGGTLFPGSTLGMSNELIASSATVAIRTGTLLVIQPDGHSTNRRSL
jgi:thiamine pyrophosphokinase